MIEFLLKLLGMPEGSGKSGKREVAALLALFTGGLIIWGFWEFDQSGRLSVLTLMIGASLAALGGAFGLHSLLKQGGLSFEKKEKPDVDHRNENT